MERITVILPVYNVENYLDRCLCTLTKQTYSNLEIILINDGSTDASPQICDNWANIDKRIKVIHKENGGVSSARNAGLRIASGDYIGFVDPDDTIDLTMYEKLINSLEENNADVAICKFCFISVKNEIIYNDEKSLVSGINESILKKCLFIFNPIKNGNKIITQNIMGSTCRCLYRKELLKECFFNETIGLSEDLLFYLDTIKKGTKISVVNEYLYHYYQNDNSAVHRINEKKIRYYFNFMCELKKRMPYFNEENKNLAMFSTYSNLIKMFLRLPSKEFKKYKSEINKMGFNTKKAYKTYKKYRTGIKNKIVDYFVFKQNIFALRMLFKLKK